MFAPKPIGLEEGLQVHCIQWRDNCRGSRGSSEPMNDYIQWHENPQGSTETCGCLFHISLLGVCVFFNFVLQCFQSQICWLMFLMFFMGLFFFSQIYCRDIMYCEPYVCGCQVYVCGLCVSNLKCQISSCSTKSFVWLLCLLEFYCIHFQKSIIQSDFGIYCFQSWKYGVFRLQCLVCGLCVFQKSNYMLVAPIWVVCVLCVLFHGCLSVCVPICGQFEGGDLRTKWKMDERKVS